MVTIALIAPLYHYSWHGFTLYSTLYTSVCEIGGTIRCSRNPCPSTCVLPPSTGPCRAAIPAFYYDQSSGTCRQFIYGGCGGNANKFRSVRDCLTMCAPSGQYVYKNTVDVFIISVKKEVQITAI